MTRSASGRYEAAHTQGAELEHARRARVGAPDPRPTRAPARQAGHRWTPTEARVVELAAEGLTNREIGERMFISRETVKTHLAHIFQKIDVHSRAEFSPQAAARRKTAS